VRGRLISLLIALSAAALGAGDRPAPEFPTADPALWINSAPLKISDLRGQVVLLDVWTFG
jgi:hypothetical protein